jgi:hypothetical protein
MLTTEGPTRSTNCVKSGNPVTSTGDWLVGAAVWAAAVGCCACDACGNKLELKTSPTADTTAPTTSVRRTTDDLEDADC